MRETRLVQVCCEMPGCGQPAVAMAVCRDLCATHVDEAATLAPKAEGGTVNAERTGLVALDQM